MAKTEVEFKESVRIVYELGYYYRLSYEGGLSSRPYYHPHDTIFFYSSGSKQMLYDRIQINTNYFDFKKMRKCLETEVNLVKVNQVY